MEQGIILIQIGLFYPVGIGKSLKRTVFYGRLIGDDKIDLGHHLLNDTYQRTSSIRDEGMEK